MLHKYNSSNLKKLFLLILVVLLLFKCKKTPENKKKATSKCGVTEFKSLINKKRHNKQNEKKKKNNFNKETTQGKKKKNKNTLTSKFKHKIKKFFGIRHNKITLQSICRKNNKIIILMHGTNSNSQAIKNLPINICKESKGKLKHSNVIFICRKTGKLKTFKNDKSDKLIDVDYDFPSKIKNNNKILDQASGLTQLLKDLVKFEKIKHITIISHSISGQITLYGVNEFCNEFKNFFNIKFHLIFVNAVLSGLYFPRKLPQEIIKNHNLHCQELKDLLLTSNKKINYKSRNCINNIYNTLGQNNIKITVTASISDFLEGCNQICKLEDNYSITKSLKSSLGLLGVNNEMIKKHLSSYLYKTDGTLYWENCIGGRIYNISQKIKINGNSKNINEVFEVCDKMEENIFSDIIKHNPHIIDFIGYQNINHTNFFANFSKTKKGIIKSLSKFNLFFNDDHRSILNIFFKNDKKHDILGSNKVARDLYKKIVNNAA